VRLRMNKEKDNSFSNNEEILTYLEEASEKVNESVQLLESMEQFLDNNLTDELLTIDSIDEISSSEENHDPIQASLKASKGILIDCLSPNIKYPLKCVALGAQVLVAINGGASISLELSIALGNPILEEQF